MRTLFHRLVDDAALFPPGNAPMPDAVTGHRDAKAGTYSWLVGRFLCPASRLAELNERLQPEDNIELGLIADTGLDGLPEALATVGRNPRLRLAMIEIAVSRDDMAASATKTINALPSETTEHLELPRADGWRDALDEIAAAGRGAKLRTGGLSAELFPAPGEVAAFISACAERNVPFKCTAGLHHAVRHTDASTGFTHHGFLNILLATCAAVSGQDPEAILAATDADELAALAQATDDVTAKRARKLFVAYGSCSLAEPHEDLVALGLTREG